MSAALYPRVFDSFESFRSKYGPVDKLNTKTFLVGLQKGEETDVCLTQNLYELMVITHFIVFLMLCFLQIQLEKGKMIHVQMVTEGELRADGQREVFFDYNGQMRSVFVRDNEATKVTHIHVQVCVYFQHLN